MMSCQSSQMHLLAPWNWLENSYVPLSVRRRQASTRYRARCFLLIVKHMMSRYTDARSGKRQAMTSPAPVTLEMDDSTMSSNPSPIRPLSRHMLYVAMPADRVWRYWDEHEGIRCRDETTSELIPVKLLQRDCLLPIHW